MITKKEFTEQVEVLLNKGATVMDAIIKVCENNDIEMDDVRKFISPVIKDKLEAEAMELNLLPKKNSIDESLFK